MFMNNSGKQGQRRRQAGQSLFVIGVTMVGMLGMAAISVDLVSLYVARSEAQRAADAAALAGATIFVSSGCTSNSVKPCSGTTILSDARTEAETVGNQNLVGNQSPGIIASDISFNTTNSGNPTITVTVSRTKAHGNAMPAYFGKIFGYSTVDVSASATAEAYNFSGQGSGAAPICLSCIKPMAVPNCDPFHSSPSNSSCSGMGYFIYPPGNGKAGQIANPGTYPNGVIGEMWTVEAASGSGNNNSLTKQFFYQLNFNSGGSSGFDTNVQTCNASNVGCGDSLPTLTPNESNTENDLMNLINQSSICEPGTLMREMKERTMREMREMKQGGGGGDDQWQGKKLDMDVYQIIHERNKRQKRPCGFGGGQDTIDTSSGPPFAMTGGNNNPNPSFSGQQITQSNAVVTVPIYNGSSVTTGSGSVTVVGFMQVFISEICDINSRADFTSVILNVTGCTSSSSSGCSSLSNGGGGSGPSGSHVSGGGASMIPVRLIQSH